MLQSEKGSVMLEFCLVLPIYLLLFGGTFLMFDISMGRLHLQEANRNLAWLQSDRYDSEGKINQTLYQRSVDFFELRNVLESTMTNESMWSFGTEYNDYRDKKNEPAFWGHKLKKFKKRGVEIELNNCWAQAVEGLAGNLFENDFHSLYSGNMELKMEKISAVYIGAVGLSSVLFPNTDASGNETSSLYDQAYLFTRARDKDGNPLAANDEMLLLRRTGGEARNKIRSVNNLFFQNIIFRSWPSNGTLGDVQLFLGVKMP